MALVSNRELKFLPHRLLFFFLILIFNGAFSPCPPDNLHGYPNPSTLVSMLQKQAEQHPQLVTFQHLGYSFSGRPVPLTTIGRGEGKAVMINGAHHGDEKITVLVVLGFLDFILKKSDVPEIKSMLEKYRFYLVPLVNPDGYCMHTRTNAQGIDINRDYLPEAVHSGGKGFLTPEARILRDLSHSRRFRGALALHSGDEAVYWPLGESPEPSAHHQLFTALARATATNMGFVRWMQSFYDYPTQGEFIDYVYKKHHILGLTVEVSGEHLPAEGRHLGVIKRGIAGILAYIESLENS